MEQTDIKVRDVNGNEVLISRSTCYSIYSEIQIGYIEEAIRRYLETNGKIPESRLKLIPEKVLWLLAVEIAEDVDEGWPLFGHIAGKDVTLHLNALAGIGKEQFLKRMEVLETIAESGDYTRLVIASARAAAGFDDKPGEISQITDDVIMKVALNPIC